MRDLSHFLKIKPIRFFNQFVNVKGEFCFEYEETDRVSSLFKGVHKCRVRRRNIAFRRILFQK